MTVHATVRPSLLRWAVERAGWDLHTLSAKAPHFEAWAAGTETPTFHQLEKFAHDTHVPFGQLFLSEPPYEPLPIPDLRTLDGRPIARPSADLLDTVFQCQIRQEWFRNHLIETGAPSVALVGSEDLDQPPREVAERLRALLGFTASLRELGSDYANVIKELIKRLESLGVLVMVNGVVGANTHRVLDPLEFRGFALADPLAPLIFVNGADSKPAKVFTLLHEVAHLLLGSSGVSAIGNATESTHGLERWTNKVAALCAVPAEQLRADFSGLDHEGALEELATRFNVSTLAILNRLYEEKLIDRDEYFLVYGQELERARERWIHRDKSESHGNFYNSHPRRIGRLFAREVIASALQGNTTYRDAYRLLGIKSHTIFEQLAEKLGVR
ncbi:ImmA/IrrE family metallo-endopeptidase [Glutamicibacter endophyticus]